MNSIKCTIERIEKSHTEYKFHLDGDILAVANVFKTYRFVHIRHYRDESYSLDRVCCYSHHFEDLVKLLGEKQEGNPSTWKYFCETMIKNGVTIERKDDHIEKCSIGEFTQTVRLKKLSVNKNILNFLNT